MWFSPYSIPKSKPKRSHFGLKKSHHVYACAQFAYKLLPAFDFVLRDLLVADPLTHIILIEDSLDHVNWQFTRRLKMALTMRVDLPWLEAEAKRSAAMGLDADGVPPDEPFDDERTGDPSGADVHAKSAALLWARVHFFPRRVTMDFRQLLLQADVVLMPFPYDGSRTASEALALGLPTVTLPTDQVFGQGGELKCWHIHRVIINTVFPCATCEVAWPHGVVFLRDAERHGGDGRVRGKGPRRLRQQGP